MESGRLLTVLALALAPACQMSQYSSTLTRAHLGACPTTATETDVFEALAQTGPIAVTLRSTCHGGRMAWTLTDPTGTVRWRGWTDGGTLDVEQLFGTITGPWRVETSLEEYSGSYSLAMRAQGGARLRVELAPRER